MALTAEYSQITWDEFFQPTFAVYPDLEEQFKAEFITYKSTGAPSNMLGRDAPFDFPPFAVDANVQPTYVNLHFRLAWNAKQKTITKPLITISFIPSICGIAAGFYLWA